MKVAVIGAGVSGLATARALSAAGFEVVVYEERDDVGGVWSASRRYPGVRTQNDKRTYAFSDLAMPADYEEYPSGAAVQSYLAGYARHHHLERVIRLGAHVDLATPTADGWDIDVTEAGAHRTDHADWLVVASGICSMPNVPTYAGQDAFVAAGGSVLPSTELGDGEVLDGRHVVVVGYGKSAADIAVAAIARGRSVVMVVRGLAWKLPFRVGRLAFQRIALTRLGEHVLWAPTKTVFGKVFRRIDRPIRARLIGRLERTVRSQLGLDRLGLVPRGSLADFTHLVTPGFFEAIDTGAIRLEKGVRIASLEAAADGRFAVLSDGARVPADVVVTATGFDQDLGFLSREARDALLDDGEMALFLHTLPADLPRIAFVGWANSFRSPIGAEMQALWITALLLGTVQPPDRRTWHSERRFYRLTHTAAAAKGAPQFSHGASIVDFDRWIAEAGARAPRGTRFRELLHPLDPASYASLLADLVKRATGRPVSAPDESA